MPLAAALLAASCASAGGPPRGPEHTPVNSPEAQPRCPDEWRAAKQAREELLGVDGAAGAATVEAAAAAVLAHARCEGAALDGWRVEAGSGESMAAALRQARRRYQDARNLFEEAAGYPVARVRVGAQAELAALHLGFARMLAEVPSPVDVQDAAGRADFRRQMREAVASFEVEAALAAARAVSAVPQTGWGGGAPGGQDPELAGWVRSACELLAVLDPDGRAAAAGPCGGDEP
jgi:hypothetical protein